MLPSMAPRMVSIVLGTTLFLGALASTATAAATPECFTPETWDRPGLDRPRELDWHRAWGVELARGPSHGRLTGFAFDDDAQAASWHYRADDNAPAEDSLDLRLTGPGGLM